MTIKYLDSKRLEGVAGDLTATPVIGVGGWKEIGRTTLGSSSSTITVSSLANKRYYMALLHNSGQTGSNDGLLRVGNGSVDTGSNYSRRISDSGGTDNTAINQTSVMFGVHPGGTTPLLSTMYISNLASQEKLMIGHTVSQDSSGAGENPKRSEQVNKWANTSVVIDAIQALLPTQTYNANSELVVLGWDPSDTNTDNFWEPLGSTTLATAGDNIEVTFTAKKYLMVKFYRKPTGAADARWTFNNDGSAKYASRKSYDGGSDSTAINQNYFTQNTYDNNEPSYSSTMIINTAGQEKLGTQHEVNRFTAGAGNATARSESVFKWTNTSDQITTIDITNSKSGSYDVGSRIEVWGHD